MQTTLYDAWLVQNCTVLYVPAGTVIDTRKLATEPGFIVEFVDQPFFMCSTVIEPYHIGGCL